MRPEEFKSRILPLQPGLYRFAKSLLNNREEAEDCVQEVLLRLWTKRETLIAIQNLKAYCFQMTRNRCLDMLKNRNMDLKEIETGMRSEIDIHRQAEMSDKVAILHAIVSRLPELQQTVIHLRNIEAWEIKEIAEVTGMTIEHTRVTLSRALFPTFYIFSRIYN